jgi:putative RecB family exonuclease
MTQIEVAGALADYPTSLSPSRAGDFMTCPLLFRFRSIDVLPQVPSPAALRGTMVHRALELLFDLPVQERTVAEATQLLQRSWEELLVAEPASAAVLRAELSLGEDAPSAQVAEAVIAPAATFIDSYFALENPQRLEPHEREFGISVEITDNFTIRGFIDRVDRTPAGDIRIVDYKTGRAPSARYEDKAMFQMRFYALAWWRLTGVVPKMLQLVYLGSKSLLRYEPTESDLKATEAKILALRAAINSAATSGVFAPTTSKLCDWCSYRNLCPAWGGTPPELPPVSSWAVIPVRGGLAK